MSNFKNICRNVAIRISLLSASHAKGQWKISNENVDKFETNEKNKMRLK